MLEERGTVAGFFPFQRSAWNVGRPVGSRLSDLQAVIAEPGWEWRPEELVRCCHLNAWEFYLLAAAPPGLKPHCLQTADALYADLSNGFEHYRQQKRQAGSEKFKQVAKLARRAERQIGTLRFVHDTREPAVVAQLMAWKTDQYRRTHAVNVLAFGWVVELLHRILDCTDTRFCGMLSALYFGDRLAAVELSLRSHEVLHGWFAAYNPEFSTVLAGHAARRSDCRSRGVAGNPPH